MKRVNFQGTGTIWKLSLLGVEGVLLSLKFEIFFFWTKPSFTPISEIHMAVMGKLLADQLAYTYIMYIHYIKEESFAINRKPLECSHALKKTGAPQFCAAHARKK